MEHRAFIHRVSFIVAVGFCVATTGATWIDARIPSHVRFGARSYRYGYWMSIVAVPLFFLTAGAVTHARTRGWKCVAVCAPLLLAAIGSQFAFAPEIPHFGVTATCLEFAIVAVVATWLHFSAPDASFVRDASLPVQTRIEALKAVTTLWQGIALATCAGFVAVLVPWSGALVTTNAHVVSAERDLFLLNAFALTQMSLVGVAFFAGPVQEIVIVVIRLTSEFSNIREDAAIGADVDFKSR